MTDLEKFSYTVLTGLIVWVIKQVVEFILIQSRITDGLLEEIQANISEIKEAKLYLTKLETIVIAESPEIIYLDKFTKTEASFYKTQISVLPRYFRSANIRRINKFFHSFWELQVLIEGLMAHIQELTEKGELGNSNEQERLTKKFERVKKLIDLLTEKTIDSIGNLPENYEGRISPDRTLSSPERENADVI